MTHAGPVDLTPEELDTMAWQFLASEFAGQIYTNWPIDRRIYAYLLRRGLIAVANDGGAYHAVLECVMANIGQAQRNGTLPPSGTKGPVDQRESGTEPSQPVPPVNPSHMTTLATARTQWGKSILR